MLISFTHLPGDGPVATADERRNIAGLDNVMSVFQSSPLVKELPARKNELLHAFFRDDPLARTKDEPIAVWLVRYNEQLGKLNRVGLDIVTSLPDAAGWQALNLAGLTEDRIERVVSRLPDDTFPLDTMSAELNRVFASVHMSESCVFNSSHEIRVLIIAGDSPDPHLRQREHKITLLRPYSGTRLRRLSTLRTRTMTALTPLIRAICRNMCEMNSRCWANTCMDNGENDAPIPSVDNSQLEAACLKLAELPEALAIVQAARRGASDQNRHSRASPGGKGKSRQPFGRQRVPNSARDQRPNDDRPALVVGRTQRPRPQPQQRRGTDLQAKLDKRKARSVCHACGQTGRWAGDPQCPGRPVNVIELEDEVQEFEPSQDTGTRQILSVQVDVSEVRLLRPSTRLVLAMNSMDVGRREGARGVIDTAARHTVAGRAWDRAYRQICAERGIGHLINVIPESEVYRFGNGGLLTSTVRVTFVVQQRCAKAMCYPC